MFTFLFSVNANFSKKMFLVLVFVLTIISLLTGDCFIHFGENYAGRVSVTKSGRSCQYWKSNFPHRIQYVLLHSLLTATVVSQDWQNHFMLIV